MLNTVIFDMYGVLIDSERQSGIPASVSAECDRERSPDTKAFAGHRNEHDGYYRKTDSGV